MIRYQNKDWELSVVRNMNLFFSCLDVAGHYNFSKNFGLPPLEHLFLVENGSRMHAHWNKKNAIGYNRQIVKICLNASKFRKLESAYKKYGKELWRASENLEKNPGAEEYKKYIQACLNLTAGLYLTTAIGRLFHDLLIEKLRLRFPVFSQSQIEWLVSEITYPTSHTPLAQSRLDMLDICAELQKRKTKLEDIRKFPKLAQQFEDYCEKYCFIPVNFNEDPWTCKDILGQMKAMAKNDCRKEKRALVRGHQERIKKSRLKLKEIKNAEIKQMAEVLQTGTILNENRKYVFCRASLAYRPLFKKIAAKNKLKSWKDCWKLTPEEIFELHFMGNKQIIRAIKNRDWAGIIYSAAKPGYKILEKNEIKQFIKEIEGIKKEEKTSSSQEIKGSIANMGKVTGRAKIVMGRSDFGKFKDGDILVTAMTSVDFIPLMERAGAFVTNEGGITSHASIVSRELGKPCVIGTKIATKVLHDGDQVEVDADNGVVKILKRAKG